MQKKRMLFHISACAPSSDQRGLFASLISAPCNGWEPIWGTADGRRSRFADGTSDARLLSKQWSSISLTHNRPVRLTACVCVCVSTMSNKGENQMFNGNLYSWADNCQGNGVHRHGEGCYQCLSKYFIRLKRSFHTLSTKTWRRERTETLFIRPMVALEVCVCVCVCVCVWHKARQAQGYT